MPVKTNEREYRRIDVKNLEIRSEDDGQMIVEGYATTFDNEYDLWDDGENIVKESVSARAFDTTDMSDVIMQYDHAGRVFARSKNGTLDLTVDDHGLKIRANLGGTEIGRQLYEEIRGGYTDKMSFGFAVNREKDGKTIERDSETNKVIIHRTINEIRKIYDVSAVSLPANGATEIYSARSFAEGVIDETRKEIAAEKERQRKIQKIRILMEVQNHDD